MRSFSYAAGIRIGDERPVKERIEDAIDGMMQKPVADTRLVDVARLRMEILNA